MAQKELRVWLHRNFSTEGGKIGEERPRAETVELLTLGIFIHRDCSALGITSLLGVMNRASESTRKVSQQELFRTNKDKKKPSKSLPACRKGCNDSLTAARMRIISGMEYTCTLPPLSIHHRFSLAGSPLSAPPFFPTVPWPAESPRRPTSGAW